MTSGEQMTSDEQEARSRVYSPYAKWVVPLKSGRIAVFSHPHNPRLIAICDTWPEAASINIQASPSDDLEAVLESLTADEIEQIVEDLE